MTPPDGVTLRDVVDAELRGVHTELRGMRESIDTLTRQMAEGATRSSREHTDMRAAVGAVQRQLDTAVPSSEEHGRFKQYVYDRFDRAEERIDVVEDNLGERAAVEKWKRRALAALTGCGGLLVGVVGLVLTHT